MSRNILIYDKLLQAPSMYVPSWAIEQLVFREHDGKIRQLKGEGKGKTLGGGGDMKVYMPT